MVIEILMYLFSDLWLFVDGICVFIYCVCKVRKFFGDEIEFVDELCWVKFCGWNILMV